MNDLVISWIRTGCAVLVGALITWAVRQGLIADASVQGPLTEVLMVVFTSAWYFVVRLLEKVNPAFGFFLGVPKAPVYTPPPVSPVQVGVQVGPGGTYNSRYGPSGNAKLADPAPSSPAGFNYAAGGNLPDAGNINPKETP